MTTVNLEEVQNTFLELTTEINRTGHPITVLNDNKPWVIIQPADGKSNGDATDVTIVFMNEYADVFSGLER